MAGEFHQKYIIRQELDTFLLTKYPDRDQILGPDLATAHYAGASTRLLEDSGTLYIIKRDSGQNESPNTVLSMHVGYDQARNVPRRLGILK